MLDYLFSSKAKLSLLNLLWKNKITATASDLAKLTNFSFATVYVELQNMEFHGLVQSVQVGNSRLYSARLDLSFAKPLLDLLNLETSETAELDFSNVTSDDVALNMSLHGAPLGKSGKPTVQLSLEQTVALALRLAHQNPTVARTLPVLLYANREHLNLSKLRYYAERVKEKQSLGFFLDLTGKLAKNKKFKVYALELFDKRLRKEKEFFHNSQGSLGKQLSERNTPDVARKWKFLMNMELGTFQSLFDKFAGLSA